MNTDRELLERAAKAAGFEYNSVWFDEQTGLLVWEPPTNYESRNWNPLSDDGAALRLAVQRRIAVWPPTLADPTAIARPASGEMEPCFEEPDRGDPHAATRRAIVRVAAAMAP